VERTDFEQVLWLGGMSGVGKTTNGRAVARKYDLRFYSLDSYTYDHHRNRVRPEEHPALTSFDTLSVEELWVETTGREIADRFEAACRERFEFVLDDLLALPRDAPILVEGPQLLPDLIAPLLADADQALYLVADTELQQRLVAARGQTSYERSSNPERAVENRAERDVILSQRLQAACAQVGLPVVQVHDPSTAPQIIETHFNRLLQRWDARGERGDVASRRRDESDARLRQWRLHADETRQSTDAEISLACECDQPACTLTVVTTLRNAEETRIRSLPLIAAEHRKGESESAID
jgi:2-phosphoglycerate kinase